MASENVFKDNHILWLSLKNIYNTFSNLLNFSCKPWTNKPFNSMNFVKYMWN